MIINVIHNSDRYHEIEPLLNSHKINPIRGVLDIISAYLRQDRRSAVLVESYGRYALLGFLARFILGGVLILRVRGSILEVNRDRLRHADTRLERARLRLGEFIIRVCLRTCDAIAYNSKHARNKLSPYVGELAKEKVVYIPFTENRPRVESTSLDIPNDGFNILTVTNMNFKGKADPTLKAMTRWVSSAFWENYNIRWVVLGEGRHLETFRHEIRRHGLQQRVQIPGWVEDPFPYYEWCDVYVHMTRLDGFPNATMEAMSRFRPVIANVDSCGVREQVFDGRNGYLVHSKNEFEDRLREYASQPKKRLKHGQEGHHLVNTRWTIGKQRERLNDLLSRLEEPASSTEAI